MSIFKRIFGTKRKEQENSNSINEYPPDLQLKIEQSRISYELAVEIETLLNQDFEIKDLRVVCSVSEHVIIVIDGIVKDEETKQNIEKKVSELKSVKLTSRLRV